MEINKLLLEAYLIFGIIVTYSMAIVIGMIIGEKNAEEKEYQKYVKQIQSKKEKFINDSKFKILEQGYKT